MNTRVAITAVAVVLGIVCAAAPAVARTPGSLKALDSDHDGTVDLNEAATAANQAFDRLDRDHDGTLSARELRGRLSARELAAADDDHDGTLTRSEYAAAVEKRFKAANRDSDDTLDDHELRSGPGKALQRLIR